VSIRDVTERRQREQRLDVLNRALRHDLRNEANVILGYAELGMKNNPDAEWVQEIQDHVAGMIDLSTKARQIEQAIGNGDVSPRPVEMVSTVESAVEDIDADRPDVEIDTDLPDTANARAIEFVGAAITNALENAIEHNDNPDPLVEVSVALQTTDEDVLVEISDNGPGIHPDEREVLLRGRETQLEHVSGLGLWIINWIVTESGGEVRFAENDPRGSIITIRLPRADEEPTGNAAVEPSTDDDETAGADEDETDTTDEATAEGVATDADVQSAGESTGDLSSPVEGSEFGPSS
jgi:signal transduction histidine kinase